MTYFLRLTTTQMAGIYIHIPFCKQACNYCNFHFSTSLRQKDDLLLAIHQELAQRKDYLQGQVIETVYFGGGTPSLLSADEILKIWEIINQHYTLKEKLEVTLEANPDDLSVAYLQALKKTPINRFSIGIQSFFDEDLQLMNRAHNAQEAKGCIQSAQDAGFENLTVDLIYGSPTTSHAHWIQNLEKVFELKVPHLSCYALTVEPKTALAHQIKTGKRPSVEDNHTAEQFEILLEQIEKHGYEQYEISNFCRDGHYAQHNSNYWKGEHYLGIGPSAHSFNGVSRQWNIAHNPKYIQALKNAGNYWEVEVLTPDNQYNEFVMTALRTKWGVDIQKLSQWGIPNQQAFINLAESFIQEGLMQTKNGVYTLTNRGKLVADAVMSEFFLV